MRGGGDGLPLLRGIAAQTIAGVAGEEQVIVFADRVRCLRQLAHTLRERHGVDAHVGDGSHQGGRLRGAQAALLRRRVPGAVPVADRPRGPQPPDRLACSSTSTCRGCRAASSSASGAPPGPAPRAARCRPTSPTSRAPASSTSSPCSPRAAASTTRSSTPSKASPPAESTIATQLGAITGQVADAKDQAGYAGTAARLRVAAAVFGA